MRRVTALDGVGQPMDGRLVGAPEVRGLSLSVKEGSGGKNSMFPLFPPVPPLSAVSVSHPLEGFSHLAPVEPRALSCLIFLARWRTTLRFCWRRNCCYHCEGGDPCLPPRVVVEARGERISASLKKTRNEPPSSDAEFGRPPPLLPPLDRTRARARASACLPLRRGCLDSLENRRHTGTEFHGWRTRACCLETTRIRRSDSFGVSR